jgi:glycerol-3-phosphate dehydrogenase (NAD(P)+)
MTQVAVIGAGAWGTALADLLARNGAQVTLWAYEADVAAAVQTQHENPRFLPGIALHPALRGTADLAAAVQGAAMVLFVAPSSVLRRVARQAAAAMPADATLVVASKGIEAESFALMTDVVAEELPGRPVVALSGPSFAAEVAQQQPTAVVAASSDAAAAQRVQQLCSNETFRVYTHHDVTGVELGGALKNVMAIAVGIADGLGLGYNTRAALITRGLAEIARLGGALGADLLTFAGLAGMGDLVLTCTGPLSRNRTLGLALGEGRTLAEAQAGRETVAEGVPTAASAHALAAARGIEMPIVAAVHGILFEGAQPAAAIGTLMRRELRGERD